MESRLFSKIKMLKNKLTILFLVSFVLLFEHCSSPTELNTPIKVTPKEREKTFIRPQVSYFSFEENGVEQSFYSFKHNQFEIKKSEIFVDTLTQPPRIWFRLIVEKEKNGMMDNNWRISIKSFNFNIDSFPVLGIPLNIQTKEYPNTWIKFLLHRGKKESYDTLVDPCKLPNSFEINFSLNKPYREIWATGYSKLYNTRFETILRDTTIVDSVKKYRWDTTWVDNQPILKKVEYWEKKEIKMKIEEITPFPDSLILNFKFRMKY